MRISDWSSDVCSSELPEAGFGPRETRRYGDHGRSGRERTERGHYSAERPRDYAGNDWNRTYGARRYWDDDQRYDERQDKDRYRGARDGDWRGREERQRSEERRVGQECGRTGRSRWEPEH